MAFFDLSRRKLSCPVGKTLVAREVYLLSILSMTVTLSATKHCNMYVHSIKAIERIRLQDLKTHKVTPSTEVHNTSLVAPPTLQWLPADPRFLQKSPNFPTIQHQMALNSCNCWNGKSFAQSSTTNEKSVWGFQTACGRKHGSQQTVRRLLFVEAGSDRRPPGDTSSTHNSFALRAIDLTSVVANVVSEDVSTWQVHLSKVFDDSFWNCPFTTTRRSYNYCTQKFRNRSHFEEER